MHLCGNCIHFRPHFPPEPGQAMDDDEPGLCGWTPPPLPHSWKYATREVIGVSADDETDCAQFVDARW